MVPDGEKLIHSNVTKIWVIAIYVCYEVVYMGMTP